MAGAKKFGTFGGVFTPSILTILGVIMYMRLGWVVGNAGLYGTIILLIIAHVISVSTGLSISSIATDKKVGAGGVYYVLSRSLGLPIGGAIGVTLFVATALSIALYLVGFAESFNNYFGLDTSINGLRITGTVSLVILGTIALISTAVAIKTQYFIMAAIGLSLVSIFLGSWEYAPESVPIFGGEQSVPLETVFAILFPAVTGFTAGIAMSGDLKDPKKSIPAGTIAAIVVGFIVYVGLAIFLAYAVKPEMLRSDYNVLMKIALFAPAVVAGIWGATLSSALGGILGGPRIMQAMAIDRIMPRPFAKGVGRDNEPWNALFITILIAWGGILIGELDMIARVVSMFYLAAYGFINLSFFLESWASADFNPSFKIPRWVGLVGFLATFAVMFKLDMAAMFLSFLIIGGIYVFLQRKQLALGSGDVWNSVWSSLVLRGLQRMDKKKDHIRNWRPNIILFSGTAETRPYLVEIAKAIAGKLGVVSNFHLVENPGANVLFPKHKQSIADDPLSVQYGIFSRQQTVRDIYEGVETIARTYGFSGLEPNTILMGWSKNTKDPLKFAQMTQTLIDLDYNVLYLDYDWNKKFGDYKKIDIWWRSLHDNVELSLNLAKFINSSPQWADAEVRVILINETSKEGFERKIYQILDTFRLDAEVKVINNYVEKKSSYDLMKKVSHDTDLIIAGIPEIPKTDMKDFVEKTTEMFSVIGTTLMIKSSSVLGEGEQTAAVAEEGVFDDVTLDDRNQRLIPVPKPTFSGDTQAVDLIIEEIELQSEEITENKISSFFNVYKHLVQDCLTAAKDALNPPDDEGQPKATTEILQKQLLEIYREKLDNFASEDLPYLEEIVGKLHEKFAGTAQRALASIPPKIKVEGKTVALRKVAQRFFKTQFQEDLHHVQNLFGQLGYQMHENIRETLTKSIRHISDDPKMREENAQQLEAVFSELVKNIQNRLGFLSAEITNKGRMSLQVLIKQIVDPTGAKKEQAKSLSRKEIKLLEAENAEFSSHFHRNENYLNAQLKTDLQLQQIRCTMREIGKVVEAEVNESMFAATVAKLHEAADWLDRLKTNSWNANDVVDINQSLSYDDYKIQEVMSLSESAGQVLPNDLTLIKADSLLNFMETQRDELETVKVDALATYKYIIFEKFEQPLEKYLLGVYHYCMEALSKVQHDINELAQQKNNVKNELPEAEFQEKIKQIKSHIGEIKAQLELEKTHEKEELKDILQAVNSSLTLPFVVEQSVRVLPKIKAGATREGIKKWLGAASRKTEELVYNYTNIISSGKGAASSSGSQGSTFTDTHWQLKRFVDGLENGNGSVANLPFYYKQLFVGKSSPSVEQMLCREEETEQAFSMLQSPNPDNHAILVLGEPLSGKSYFSEAVAKKINSGKVVKILPPSNGSVRVVDLVSTLQKQLKTSARGMRILNGFPKGTVFIFEDIELWWQRNNPGGNAIKFLVELVEENKSKYAFILNVNRFAFPIMEAQGLFDHLNASKVYLSNFTPNALRELLLKRHAAGGLRLELNGKSEQDISPKDMHKLMDRFLLTSRGIVGLALHQWINNIVDFQDDRVVMKFPEEHVLPKFEDKELLLVLSQILIHKHLDASKLQQIFGYPERGKADLIIRKLNADGILHDTMGSTYELTPLVIPAIVKRMEGYGLV